MTVPPRARLLVVEDEAAQRQIIVDILTAQGYTVLAAGDGEEALRVVADTVPDLVLSDWKMPGMSGGDLLQAIRADGYPCAFVVMTAYGSISHAVHAVQLGADDYLAKPFEREALLLTVRRALRTRHLEEENRRLQEAAGERDGLGEIRGRAPAMQRLYQTIEKVAPTDATVLITGESGTGKELVARTLHRLSRRGAAPFVAVNCAAIPETLMESELFGHERGAFTGADRRRLGRFEEAEGGTLFLDEIASMPQAVQAALLRALQERRITRVGGGGEIACDVRVVAASNRDLAELADEGAFRDDLYYRLNVVPLRLPPLRERREDIPILAAGLLERASRRHGRDVAPLPPAVLRHLMTYGWPGNVRQLANVVERLVLLADGDMIRTEDLPAEILTPAPATASPFRIPPGGVVWDDVERDLLQQALTLAGGNRRAAARLLGMSYKTFLYRLDKKR